MLPAGVGQFVLGWVAPHHHQTVLEQGFGGAPSRVVLPESETEVLYEAQ